MVELFEEVDVLIIDRGFRDVADLLDDLASKIKYHIFSQNLRNSCQLQKPVTKVRWVVESVNGRVKQWRALSNVMPNSQIPFIGDYVGIGGVNARTWPTPFLVKSELMFYKYT